MHEAAVHKTSKMRKIGRTEHSEIIHLHVAQVIIPLYFLVRFDRVTFTGRFNVTFVIKYVNSCIPVKECNAMYKIPTQEL